MGKGLQLQSAYLLRFRKQRLGSPTVPTDFNRAGSAAWSSFVFSATIVIPDLLSAIPGLAVGVGLGLPMSTIVIPDLLSAIPGLAVGVGLGLPASVVPSPPDPAAPRVAVQTIYRLYITGGDWLEIPLISFQCQRRLGASTWMTAIVGYASALRNALDARLALEGRMSLFYGVRYSDGSEQLGEVMQAALTQIDEEREPYRGTLTIRGRVITPSYVATSRVLQAVSARGRDDQGRRTCACAVDPLLRPNDTVHDGANEWTAGVIQYDISPSAALMRIREV